LAPLGSSRNNLQKGSKPLIRFVGDKIANSNTATLILLFLWLGGGRASDPFEDIQYTGSGHPFEDVDRFFFSGSVEAAPLIRSRIYNTPAPVIRSRMLTAFLFLWLGGGRASYPFEDIQHTGRGNPFEDVYRFSHLSFIECPTKIPYPGYSAPALRLHSAWSFFLIIFLLFFLLWKLWNDKKLSPNALHRCQKSS